MIALKRLGILTLLAAGLAGLGPLGFRVRHRVR
jgi:hypothetical protein